MGNNFDKNFIQNSNKEIYIKYLEKKIKGKKIILNPKDEIILDNNKTSFKISKYKQHWHFLSLMRLTNLFISNF